MRESKLEFTPTYERLPSYLRFAEDASLKKQDFVSGTSLAGFLGLSPIQVRKDLAFAGLKGIPKRGYKVSEIIDGLKIFLTWNKPKKAILIGAGNLGKAVLLCNDFKDCGLDIVGIFGNDKDKIGDKIGRLEVLDIADLAFEFERLKPFIAIISVDEKLDAQELANLLAEKGIKGIWNFTTQKIRIKGNVAIYNSDFTADFAVLCADIQRRNG